MKQYLKNKKIRISMILISIFFVSNILTLLSTDFYSFVLLRPSDLGQPWNWYRFLTYPLYVGGLLTWLQVSLVIFFTSLIIENRLGRKKMIGLILLSCIIGGLSFIITNQGDITNRAIASPTMISWGYWTSAIIIGLKFWKDLNKFEKVVIILCFLSIISLFSQDLGSTIAQFSVVISVLIFTFFTLQNIKKLHS